MYKLFLLFLIASFPMRIDAQTKTLHQFKARTIEGKKLDFSSLNGKKVLVVNTASECSLAGQLYKLQELYEEYGGEDFEIVAFPSNDFGKHEPATNKEIEEIYRNKYHIAFTIMEKVHVKGARAHPVYQWLTNSEKNGTLDAKVMWNFQKFLVDEKGFVVDVVSPIGSPTKNRITDWLQEDL